MKNQKVNLDLKDKKILSELDWNARISNSEIARISGLSKKGVEYRIKNFESKNIILGYYPIIDFMKLGYYYGRFILKLQYINPQIKKEIENYIKKNKVIRWAVWMEGTYDLGMGFWTKSLSDFKKATSEFSVHFSQYIKDKFYSIATRLDQYPYNILDKPKDNRELVLKESEELFKIDELDKKILECLTLNARQDSSEIARKVGSNYKVISYRIKKLTENKILLGTRALINPSALGLTHYKVFFFLTKNPNQRTRHLKDYLKQKQEVIYFVDDIGVADLDVELLLPSNQDFFNFIEDVQDKFSGIIKDYNYLIMLETIQINYLPED